MKFHITRLNGWSHNTAVYKAQNDIADIAGTMGFKDLAVYNYNSNGESWESRSARYDGMIAGIERGDIVIMQLPTWHKYQFDEKLVDRLLAYGANLAIFIHDVQAWMYEPSAPLIDRYVNIYNKARCLIVPSENMKQKLIEHGVSREKKFIIQGIWDYLTDVEFYSRPLYKKEVHLPAGVSDFDMLDKWNGDVMLKLYASTAPAVSKDNISYRGFYEKEPLLYELHKGGFGLLWGRNDYWHEYLKLNCSFKLGNFMAAGIPVIFPKGMANEELYINNHLGIAVDSLDEAVNVVEHMTQETYLEYVSAVERFAPLVRKGYFGRKILTDTVHALLRD